MLVPLCMLCNHSGCLPADVKDILGVPRGTAGDDRLQPGVKAKPEKMKRPEGMSREAFALLGGSNPVIPTHLLGELAWQPEHTMQRLVGCRVAASHSSSYPIHTVWFKDKAPSTVQHCTSCSQ